MRMGDANARQKAVYASMLQRLPLPVQRAVRVTFCLVCIVLLAACRSKASQEREEQLKQMLGRFFSVAPRPDSPDGIYIADNESVSAMIEKKYLADYQAKPDEMKKEEIRGRMKNLQLFYRIEGRHFAMLTQVADSLGVNTGVLSPRKSLQKGEYIFDAQIRGKDGTVAATLRFTNTPLGDRLEYSESGFTILATRDKRSSEELVALIRQSMQNTTNLPQY
jgi:hypothetical protein